MKHWYFSHHELYNLLGKKYIALRQNWNCMATVKFTAAQTFPPYHSSPNGDLKRMLAECPQLRAEG